MSIFKLSLDNFAYCQPSLKPLMETTYISIHVLQVLLYWSLINNLWCIRPNYNGWWIFDATCDVLGLPVILISLAIIWTLSAQGSIMMTAVLSPYFLEWSAYFIHDVSKIQAGLQAMNIIHILY